MLFLALPLFYPLWRIKLDAPQYPEGLGMYIHVDKITGYTEYDLENINLLNHYIGMARIEPDSIPELRFMKYIIYGALAFGLITIILGKRILLAFWLRIMVLIAFVGLYDFNKWEHDYGYNLDPRAAIKVEGMAYKPPLLGKKQLLNITAHSYPSIGGIGIALSVVCAGASILIVAYSKKEDKEEEEIQKQKIT